MWIKNACFGSRPTGCEKYFEPRYVNGKFRMFSERYECQCRPQNLLHVSSGTYNQPAVILTKYLLSFKQHSD